MDLVSVIVSSSLTTAVVAGLFTLSRTLIDKRLRTPGDKLASEDFAYKVIRERLDEANADRKVLTDTVNYLREDARKRDLTDAEDFEREQKREQLIRGLNRRIGELEAQIEKYERRIHRLADKARAGEPITLADIYGADAMAPSEDLEDTLNKEQLQQIKENNNS